LGEGADDTHDPSFGIYKIQDLTPVMEIIDVNCQDYLQITQTVQSNQNMLIIGETNGSIRFVEINNSNQLIMKNIQHLPSTINTLQIFSPEIILAGCDGGFLYEVKMVFK